MAVTPISLADWQTAQSAEQAWWANEANDPARLTSDVEEGHRWTAGLLDIAPATVGGRSVLDLAAGPFPLGTLPLDLAQYCALDSLPYPPLAFGRRVQQPAEDADLGWVFDEVWGYNVLQHVRDPAAVLATARQNATKTIRWLDWVETWRFPIHPHSITADWLKKQLDGFRITRWVEGTKHTMQYSLKFVAVIAERA